MSTATGLALVLATFLTVLATVITLAFRERRLARTIVPGDVAAARASDVRVMIVIFGSIIMGMLLTLVTAVTVLGSI
jgi:predicted secreted protein